MSTYSTKSSAFTAAKNAAKKIHGKYYEAAEGIDFVVWAERDENYLIASRWAFKLLG